MPRTQIATNYTPASLMSAIRIKLGDSLVHTELDDPAYYGAGYNPNAASPTLGADGILAQTFLRYSRYWPKRVYKALATTGASMYTIPRPYYGFGVTDVRFPRENTILTLGGFSDPYLIWSGSYLRDIADVELALQYYETAEKLFGGARVWDFKENFEVDPPVGQLFINPKRAFLRPVVYEYAAPWAVEEIPFNDMDLIVDLGCALAKEAIGRARSKYGKIPGQAEGQDLDGQALIQEANDYFKEFPNLIRQRKGDFLIPSHY